MKKLVFCLLAGLLLSGVLWAQSLEVEKTHELSKTARKGELYHFSFDEEVGEYLLIYRREKKKDYEYEIYRFDRDFNLVANDQVVGTDDTRKKYTAAFPTHKGEEEWNNPGVLRVENNWGGSIVLRKGYLTREWKTKVEDRGAYRYTTTYLKYNFEEEEKIKPKFEGLVKVPEGAPAFVQKMAKSQGSKLTLVDYITDEPTVEVTTGARSFAYPSLWARTRDYASANGDVVVLGANAQMDYDTKEHQVTYLALKYGADDLSLKTSNTLTFPYPTFDIFKQHLSDGTMAFVFAPSSNYKNKDPNHLNYYFVRVSKNAEIIENINFESKGGPWKINSISLTSADEIYIFGQASLKKKEKEPQKVIGTLGEFDNLQVMKIADHEVKYFSSVTIDEANSKLQSPGNQKKVKPYVKKKFRFFAEPTITADGQILVSGRPDDHGSIHYFHFGADGGFKAQYVVKLDDPKKTAEGGLTQILINNPDGKTLTCLVAELEDINKGRHLRYPKLSTIDLAAGTISDSQLFGFGKKAKYYLDDGYPLTFVDDNSKAVFFSRDKKDKQIWFGRVSLGK